MSNKATTWFLVEGINPEPWQASQFAGRGKGRKPDVYKAEKLRVYQEALAEEFRRLYPEVSPYQGEACSVTFCFWRAIESYDLESSRGRNVIADATNLQKSTEDALQKILYENDRTVRHAESIIMDQSPEAEPAVLIVFRNYVSTHSEFTKAREWMRQAAGKVDPTRNLRPDADVPF